MYFLHIRFLLESNYRKKSDKYKSPIPHHSSTFRVLTHIQDTMQIPYQEYNPYYNQHFNYIPYEHFHTYQPVQYIHYPPPYQYLPNEYPLYDQPVYEKPQGKSYDETRQYRNEWRSFEKERSMYNQYQRYVMKKYKQQQQQEPQHDEEDQPWNVWRHYPQRYFEDFALMEKEAKRKELEFRKKERDLKIQEETLIQQQEQLLKEKEELDALKQEQQYQQQQQQQEAAAAAAASKQLQDAATQTQTANQIKPTLRFNNLPKYFKDQEIKALLTDYNIEGIYSSFDKDGNKKNSTCVCFMSEEDCLKAKEACERYLPAIHKGIQITYIKNKPKEYTRWDNFTATLIS